MTYFYYYSIKQNSFTALTTLSSTYLFLPWSLATTSLLTISVVLPFPECLYRENHIVYPIQIGFFHLTLYF